MVKSCCVLGCKQRYSKESGVSFHRFPAEPELKDQWVKALARHDWQPSYHSLVCGKHFLTGRPSADPKHPDFTPNLFPHVSMYQQYRTSYAKRMLLMSEAASAATQPTIHVLCLPDKPPQGEASSSEAASAAEGSSGGAEGSGGDEATSGSSPSAKREAEDGTPNHKKRKNSLPRRFIPPARRCLPGPVPTSGKEVVNLPGAAQVNHDGGPLPELALPEEQYLLLQRLTEKGNRLQDEMRTQLRKQQSEINLLQVQVEMLREKNAKLAREPKHTSRDVMSDVYLADKGRCLYYTGLPNNKTFLWLLGQLENEVQKPAVKISASKQLLIVLMKLKLELQHIDLGYRFGVAASTICRILKVWVPVLVRNLTSFIDSADKDEVLKSLILEEASNQADHIDNRLWPEKLLGKAANFLNGPKAKSSEQSTSTA